MESELINRTKDNKNMQGANIIDLGIYNQEILLFYGDSEEFTDYMSNVLNVKVKLKHGTTASTYDVNTHRGRKLILFVNEHFIDGFGEQYFTTVCHEVYHIVGHVLDFSGIEYNMKNDEPGAYLTGYINKEIYKLFEEEFS